MRKLAVAAATLLLAGGLTALADTHPAPARAAAAGATSLRVGSFNIQSVSLDKTAGLQRPWRQRRPTVVAQVMGEKVDVLGIQEANPSKTFASRLVDGTNQYRDLQIGLNKAGGHFALTNPYPYNCLNSSTTYKCVYRNRHASHGDRILYNSQTLSLVSEGATRYTVQGPGADPRFVVWAVLRVRATGETFLFVNTHLRAGDVSTRRSQWTQLRSRVEALANGRPVVVVGDFNTHKFDPLSNQMLPAMRNAGFGDVLNQEYQVNPIRDPRAQSTVNGWFNTANHLSRDVCDFSYCHNHDKAGNNIDWIFATNSLPVEQWKVVVNWDSATGQVRGTLPSDHNMVRATLTLP
jgi:endonuclease/exonuclease/phosphatase family metal-dependent hydrolase